MLAAGDLNILYGYGENGSAYWAARYATVFDRMRARRGGGSTTSSRRRPR